MTSRWSSGPRSRMLGKAVDGKYLDSYVCCERHRPGAKRRHHSRVRQMEKRQWRNDPEQDPRE